MTFSALNTKIKKKIWKSLKDSFFLQRVSDSNIVENINYDNNSQQKLLICYKPNGYFMNLEDYSGRTVLLEIFKIVKVFAGLGYSIDIIDCNDIKPVIIASKKKYDLIFGFGESFFQITNQLPGAMSILYMTESHPGFSLRQEKKRLEYYYERHRTHPQIRRSGKFYKEYHLGRKYSHIIVLGEKEQFSHQYEKPYSLLPTGIVNPQYHFIIKNHELSRKNFLWLGSAGAIHKGLDLLIDIFKTRDDITLHIGGLAKQEKKTLNIPQRKNIIDYGHLDIRSAAFLKIIETCTYIILPSCSEGFSTSIATGMLHGIIPVVMKDTGFNRLGDNVILLNDYKIDYINSKLTELSNDLPARLNIFSKKVFDFAHENFTLAKFEENFRIIIREILAEKQISAGNTA